MELRPLQSSDAWLLHRWFNDQRVLEDLGAERIDFCVSMDSEHKIVERIISDSDKRFFIIHDLVGGKDIGEIGLDKIDRRNANAELQVIIGEVEYWGKGYGQDAVRTLLAYAFNQLNLHRIYLRVVEYNSRGVECYKACGFRVDGRFRQDHFHKGAYRDALHMSILREEFGE